MWISSDREQPVNNGKMSKKLAIFIIDDDPIYTGVLERFLVENVDCTILCFESVRYCLHARPSQPDIVFVDYNMSDMNGLRATRMLKKRWKAAVYTLISSSENLSEKRISHFGVDMAISKSEGIDQIVTLSLRFYRFKRLMRRSWMLLMMALLAGLVTWLALKA